MTSPYTPGGFSSFSQTGQNSDIKFWTPRPIPPSSAPNLAVSPSVSYSNAICPFLPPPQYPQSNPWVTDPGIMEYPYFVMSNHLKGSTINQPRHNLNHQQVTNHQPTTSWVNIGYGPYITTPEDSSTSLASPSPDSNITTTHGTAATSSEISTSQLPPPTSSEYAAMSSYGYGDDVIGRRFSRSEANIGIHPLQLKRSP